MAHLKTANFIVQSSDEALVVQRNTRPALIGGVSLVLFLCLFVAVPIANIFIYHYRVIMNVFFACAITFSFSAFFVPLLPTIVARSRTKSVVFDKRSGQVLLDGRPFCTLAELASVHVDQGGAKSTYPSAKRCALYLETAGGERTVIDESGGVGPSMIELEEVGKTIAEFTGVESRML